MKTRIVASVVVAFVLFGAVGTVQADISVRFEPSSSVVALGDVFTVDILADIPLADAIVGYGMDAGFDSLLLGHDPLTDVAIGSSFDPAATADGDALAGTLPFAFPPLPPVSGSDILLAQMSFEALDLGTSLFTGGITPGDLLEGFVLPGGGFANVSFTGASVSVVPAPAAVLLGLLGCVLIPGITRRLSA